MVRRIVEKCLASEPAVLQPADDPHVESIIYLDFYYHVKLSGNNFTSSRQQATAKVHWENILLAKINFLCAFQ